MVYQDVFRRYELKFLLSADDKARILSAMEPYMALDRYGRTTVRNLYFDTDTYRLIRRSMEKPVYKEKLRIRSYAQAFGNDTVFVELKKKYKSVVYKRRLALPEREAMEWITGGRHCKLRTQIADEIDYFLTYYGGLKPTVFLSYEREAYYERSGGDFRVTFDENILAREDALSLGAEIYGTPLLPDGMTLMEVKCVGGIPLWMTGALTEAGLSKTSFSKYGAAYARMIYPHTEFAGRIGWAATADVLMEKEKKIHVGSSVSRNVRQ